MNTLDVILRGIPPGIWITVVVALLIMWWRATHRQGRENALRGRIARDAETRAELLLEKLGYSIIDRQVQGSFSFFIDDERIETKCRADLLVAHAGQRYLAEVKSGSTGTDPTHPSTRRQRLEYYMAFDVDGILLVDMHREWVREVAFDMTSP